MAQVALYRAFLDDITDGAMGSIGNSTTISFDDIVNNDMVQSSLAFHAAWRHAFSVPPCKPDARAFTDRLAAAGAAAAPSRWKEALQHTLVHCSPARTLPSFKELVPSCVDVYQRALSAMKERGRPEVLRLLSAKLGARFSGDPKPIHDGASAIKAYKELTSCDPVLELLEKWAGVVADPDATYYERLAVAPIAERFTGWSFITGMYVTAAAAAADAPLSAIELLRHPMMQDLSLWRKDVGGTLMLGAGACDREGVRVPFATDAPPELIARILPASGFPYARIIAPARYCHLFAAAAAASGNGIREVVSVSDDGCSFRILGTAAAAAAAAGEWWVPPGDGALGRALREDMIATRFSPRRRFSTQNQLDGYCHFQQFVATLAAKHDLMGTVFPTDGENVLGTVMVCDTRRNWWTIMCLLITLHNLDSRRWRVVFFCSEGNASWVRRELLGRVPQAHVVPWEERLGVEKFTIDVYNDLMTSSDLWSHPVFAGDHVLTIQDDGVIMRPGIENDTEMMSYDFVGAPWVQAGDNALILSQAGVDRSELVGNGGISLRRRSAMLAAISADQQLTGGRGVRTLFYQNMIPVPEDVFFSARVARCSPRSVANRFSFEQCVPSPTSSPPPTPPYAFHKPWCYLDPGVLVGMGIKKITF